MESVSSPPPASGLLTFREEAEMICVVGAFISSRSESPASSVTPSICIINLCVHTSFPAWVSFSFLNAFLRSVLPTRHPSFVCLFECLFAFLALSCGLWRILFMLLTLSNDALTTQRKCEWLPSAFWSMCSTGPVVGSPVPIVTGSCTSIRLLLPYVHVKLVSSCGQGVWHPVDFSSIDILWGRLSSHVISQSCLFSHVPSDLKTIWSISAIGSLFSPVCLYYLHMY